MGAQRRDAGRDAVHANAAIGIDVRQDHPRTVLPERLRGSGADAVHRCCHERNFPIEPASHVLSNLSYTLLVECLTSVHNASADMFRLAVSVMWGVLQIGRESCRERLGHY